MQTHCCSLQQYTPEHLLDELPLDQLQILDQHHTGTGASSRLLSQYNYPVKRSPEAQAGKEEDNGPTSLVNWCGIFLYILSILYVLSILGPAVLKDLPRQCRMEVGRRTVISSKSRSQTHVSCFFILILSCASTCPPCRGLTAGCFGRPWAQRQPALPMVQDKGTLGRASAFSLLPKGLGLEAHSQLRSPTPSPCLPYTKSFCQCVNLGHIQLWFGTRMPQVLD